MSYLRFNMDIAIKEPIPKALAKQIAGIKRDMSILKSYSEKINAGRPNEENTMILEAHICNHDTGKRCEKRHDLQVFPEETEERKKNDTMGELRSMAWIPFTKWGLARRE